MAEFEAESDITNQLAQEVQQELPTIYVSVKNLIACSLGKNYEAPLEPKMQPQNVMTCAKYLLEAIKSHPLPDVEQFCAENPQPEDQLGVDRLEDICKYKVICALRYKAEAKGGRITRLFGKSYIRWTKMWKVFRKDTEKLLRENTHIPKEEIDMFLQTYEASLLDDNDSRSRSNTSSSVSTQDLIWANDFNAVLSGMQKERCQRIEERSRSSTYETISLEQQLFDPSAVPSLKYSSSEMDVVRSRATTMEQLGLEPPHTDLDALIRCPSHDFHHQVTPDRSRATTLDLFAFEQQGMMMPVSGCGGCGSAQVGINSVAVAPQSASQEPRQLTPRSFPG